MSSEGHRLYLKRIKREKILVHFMQIFIVLLLIFIWEYLSSHKIINSFVYSSPSMILKAIIQILLRQSN